MFTASKILVPVDFSDTSRAALSFAVQWASDQNAELVLLHVEAGLDKEIQNRIEQAPDESVVEDAINFDEHALMEAYELERVRCAEAGKVLGDIPVQVRVTGGSWIEVALQMVDELQLDLIVTATHGRKGLRGLLWGSVSEQLVNKAPCSVFIVKPRGFPYLRD